MYIYIYIDNIGGIKSCTSNQKLYRNKHKTLLNTNIKTILKLHKSNKNILKSYYHKYKKQSKHNIKNHVKKTYKKPY